MADLEGLAAIVDVQLGVTLQGTLEDAEHAQFADEGIVDDLEYVGDDVRLGISLQHDVLRLAAGALAKHRRIAFQRAGK